MMRLCHVSYLVLALAPFAGAIDPVPPRVDPIRLPITPIPPQPSPPAPSAVSSLGSDQLYVIDSDMPCVVLVSPAGVVSITEDTGPVKIRAKFVDGTKTETRTYKGKVVYTLEATGNGRVELLIVPNGGTSTDVIRRTIDVRNGQEPPPDPKPNPDPTPIPVSLWGFVVVEDTSEAVALRGAMLTDSALSALMKLKGYKWRIVDQNVTGKDGKPPTDVVKELEATKGKKLPQVFLIDTKGNIVIQQPLTNAADLVSLLKQWGQ